MSDNKNKFGLIDVNTANVEETGFFCYMSKRKAKGYQNKLSWLKARFNEGLGMKMLALPERGFIEYIPGEYAWRPVEAYGYMFIHCLWVVGRSKGRGFGTRLLAECVQDAKKAGMAGVAMLSSEGNWLAGKKTFISQGFEAVDQAAPSFTLLVKKFAAGPSPRFPQNWEARLKRFGPGLTVIRSGQCPYLEDATRILMDAAAEKKIPSRTIELTSAVDVQELSPSPYGTFSIVYNGRLLGYHYLKKGEFLRYLSK